MTAPVTSAISASIATVPKQLASLRDCGLAEARPAGRASVYSLAQPALVGRLPATGAVPAATGNAVALCPVYGQGN